MPHVIVKMVTGRSPEQKSRLAAEITKSLMAIAVCTEDSVSVSIEDVAHDDWKASVYLPDIAAKPETLIKKPGYTPK